MSRTRKYTTRIRLACILLLLLAATSSCTAPRSGNNTETGPCAVALPLARAAVHDQGRLLLAKATSAARSKKFLGVLRYRRRRECVIVYRGRYAPGDVTASRGRGGRYAIIRVRLHPPTLLQVSVRDRLPPSLTEHG